MVHKITFDIENRTPFYLIPNGQFAFWGNTNSGPETIKPYSIGSGAIWIAILGSDPDWSAEANSARVAMSTKPLTMDKDLYSYMYSSNVTNLTLPTPNGHINLTCSIGSDDDTTALFTLTFYKGTGVTYEALGVVVPEEK
ncbi:uncharacterized protein FPRO_15567 [Fusarium proliferatum ET1]|uniref:Uncharacterized protein n=1 Tax=Fusarium proliferatum (strain ET1) TaxID=1227346 RepID=A0A1L7VXW3_FUSPR|nr:uncharacterized protein FPRO_15567 [Fusarium proliferatum ET1]CZR45258.1 uncharacterized protein FPRO_15567 [Fusarium proliferatum ET1]